MLIALRSPDLKKFTSRIHQGRSQGKCWERVGFLELSHRFWEYFLMHFSFNNINGFTWRVWTRKGRPHKYYAHGIHTCVQTYTVLHTYIKDTQACIHIHTHIRRPTYVYKHAFTHTLAYTWNWYTIQLREGVHSQHVPWSLNFKVPKSTLAIEF